MDTVNTSELSDRLNGTNGQIAHTPHPMKVNGMAAFGEAFPVHAHQEYAMTRSRTATLACIAYGAMALGAAMIAGSYVLEKHERK